jgi:Flp pilus assembly protein TadG
MSAQRNHRDDCSRRPDGRSGTAALEFVCVLPALIVIVLGAADLSRIRYHENVLTNAARTGAAYGATHRATDYNYDEWEAAVVARAREEATNLPDFNAGRFEVDVTMILDADGSQRVHVETSYPFAMLIDWPGWPRQWTLRQSVSMRRYR